MTSMRRCRRKCSSSLATTPEVDLLLDPHAFIWWAGVDERLTETARSAIRDADNRVVVSAVTVWEISIKRALGKVRFTQDTLRAIEQAGFETLDVTPRHADRAGSLPPHHADPYWRPGPHSSERLNSSAPLARAKASVQIAPVRPRSRG